MDFGAFLSTLLANRQHKLVATTIESEARMEIRV
jgi:hypothetical protein